MHGISCYIVFCLFVMLFPCEGLITSPPDGTNYTFISGSTNRITWTFNDDATKVVQQWFFKSSTEGSQEKPFATIAFDSSPSKRPGVLPRFNITKPGTVFLINVDESYDGTYKLVITPSESQVRVFIAKKPTVTVCSNPLIINEDEDGSCVCRGDNGNPPASVVWFDKNNKQIGEKKIGENTLTLTDVDGTDSGSYKCVAESYPDDSYRDEKTIQVNVRLNFKPRSTKTVFSRYPAVYGGLFAISCESEGLPEPNYIIFHNGSEIQKGKSYTLDKVAYSHSGEYKCVAVNKLGNDSALGVLKVVEEPTTTSTLKVNTDNTATSIFKTSECSNDSNPETEWYIIFVTLVSGIIIGVFLSYIAFRFRREIVRRRNPQQSNPEPPRSQADSTYQELDLKNMNKEDNYQALRVNAARNDGVNDDESTYTDLNKTRDVEHNYQSLT